MKSNHTIANSRSPKIWQEGFPIGNGEFGAMVWGDGNPFAFTLDRADLWDLRNDTSFMDQLEYNYKSLQQLVDEKKWDEVDEIFELRQTRDNPVGPTKISIGRAELVVEGSSGFNCGLDIDKAVVNVSFKSPSGQHQLTSFIHKSQNVLCIRITEPPVNTALRMIPLAEMSEPLSKLNHPAPTITEDGNLQVLVQEIPGGPFYCLVWNTTGNEFYLVAESGKSAEIAQQKARHTWQTASDTGFDALIESHIAQWSDFWSQSAVYLPEAHLELLWYFGIYLLASSAKKGSIPPGLQGLWAMDGEVPPWRGDYHADMNVQETFWPACASGHLDLLDSWCDHMKACIEPARKFTKAFFGTEGTFWLACTIPDYTPVPCWHTVNLGWSHTGWLGWLVWLRWRYSMDTDWLAETGYPVIAEIFKFFNANLVEESDGYLHIPLSSSPEYKENKPEAWCKDPNVDIALIRRCCDWIIEMEAALGISELTAKAINLKNDLLPYSLTEKKELCLWPGKVLDESHRHPSQLMAIHPAMDLTIDGEEDTKAIIEASVEQFLALGQYQWAGHTYAQMISFASVLDRSGWAYDSLRQFHEHWIGPNGLHFNRDLTNSGMSAFRIGDGNMNDAPFTMEASNAVSAGISDMLVQGWGDVLRIFPAVPNHWRDISFENLLTEGAFKVSAVRKKGQTIHVKVIAGADRTLNMKDPFNGAEIKIKENATLKNGIYTAQMKKGNELTFTISE